MNRYVSRKACPEDRVGFFRKSYLTTAVLTLLKIKPDFLPKTSFQCCYLLIIVLYLGLSTRYAEKKEQYGSHYYVGDM